MSLKHLMNVREFPKVEPEASVRDAIEAMVEHRTGAVLVTEGDALKGIFSERDVMRKITFEGLDPAETKVTDHMTTDVVNTNPGAAIHEAVELMHDNHIRHLPVVDDAGHVVGMVSLRDLLWDLNGDLENQAATLQNYMGADGPGG